MSVVETERVEIIPEFPDYVITSWGRVINRNDGYELSQSPNQLGIPTVGLMWEDRQYRRSTKVLVARAFVRGETEIFNTPVQLDGNRFNLRADNIVWRPRWFAHRYTSQFNRLQDWYESGPILDIINNVRYDTILDAAIANGNLCKDIRISILYERPAFPNRIVYTML